MCFLLDFNLFQKVNKFQFSHYFLSTRRKIAFSLYTGINIFFELYMEDGWVDGEGSATPVDPILRLELDTMQPSLSAER